MKRSIIFMLAAVLLIGGCSPGKHLAKTQQQQDSTRVEVRKEVVYVKDTVMLEIPSQTAERTTRDSTSHLENDYATSDARINPDGSLYHDLNTKPQEIPKEVQTPVERNDSIVYKYKYRTVCETVEVEVERELSWWQKTQMYGFWVALAVIVVGVIVSQRKKIISWLMKKII